MSGAQGLWTLWELVATDQIPSFVNPVTQDLKEIEFTDTICSFGVKQYTKSFEVLKLLKLSEAVPVLLLIIIKAVNLCIWIKHEKPEQCMPNVELF